MTQQSFSQQNQQYRGRFAPSPSGPLHFGSLVSALGSYLEAKKQQGLWFVRIEDIDKPREQEGAREQILDGLEAFGMNWDIDGNTIAESSANFRNCLVQSQRIERYQQVLDFLIEQNSVYACECTRKQIKQSGNVYLGTCRDKQLSLDEQAIRLHLEQPVCHFDDLVFGQINSSTEFANEDFIVKRRDKLFAYQLVVVVDDIDQGINHVVRGADIMELTCRQISLYQLLGVTPPVYAHLPLAVTKPGFKLSKQNHATAIDINNPIPELLKALAFLGLPVANEPQLMQYNVADIIKWAIDNWQLSNVKPTREILV